MDSVSSAVERVDVRDLALSELEEVLVKTLAACPSSACLWTACRPKKNWFQGLTEFRPLVFASSAKFEQILWLPPQAKPTLPEDWTGDCRRLLRGYPELFAGGSFLEYEDAVLQHIHLQEKELFPKLLGHLPEAQRALRELSYEHRGLENGLKRMPAVLQQQQDGTLDSRARERFDLDYYHLLEHNVERKLDAIYPALAYFDQGFTSLP